MKNKIAAVICCTALAVSLSGCRLNTKSNNESSVEISRAEAPSFELNGRVGNESLGYITLEGDDWACSNADNMDKADSLLFTKEDNSCTVSMELDDSINAEETARSFKAQLADITSDVLLSTEEYDDRKQYVIDYYTPVTNTVTKVIYVDCGDSITRIINITYSNNEMASVADSYSTKE